MCRGAERPPALWHNESRRMRKRYLAAMGFYVLLAGLAYFQFSGMVRLALWVFLGGLALKSWIHWKRLGH